MGFNVALVNRWCVEVTFNDKISFSKTSLHITHFEFLPRGYVRRLCRRLRQALGKHIVMQHWRISSHSIINI